MLFSTPQHSLDNLGIPLGILPIFGYASAKITKSIQSVGVLIFLDDSLHAKSHHNRPIISGDTAHQRILQSH